jgi:antitoxin component YwqK of YwqJK toxin-antitoxin module
MKYKLIGLGILSPLLLISIAAISQISTFYSSLDGERSNSPIKAPIISIVKKVDSLWLREDYYAYSRKIAKISYYKDTGFKYNHGEYKSYHANEFLESSGNFKEDRRVGFLKTIIQMG